MKANAEGRGRRHGTHTSNKGTIYLLRGRSAHTAPDLRALGDAAGLYCDVAGKCHACGSATG
eukprot:8395025-Heterocapsa_arctica.AAC.1